MLIRLAVIQFFGKYLDDICVSTILECSIQSFFNMAQPIYSPSGGAIIPQYSAPVGQKVAAGGNPGYTTAPVSTPVAPVPQSIIDNARATGSLPAKDIYGSSAYNNADINAAQKSANDLTGTGLDQATQDQIRASTLASFQAEIDSQNRLYADKLAAARVQGQNRLGSTTAIQARRGLLGSDFGGAQTDATNTANSGIENAINDEKAAAISAIMSKSRTTGDAAIAQRTAARQAGADAHVQFLKDAQARSVTGAKTAAELLLSNKTKPADLLPEQLQRLLSDHTTTQDALSAAYNTLESEQQQKTKDLEYKQAQLEASQASKRYVTLADGTTLFDTLTNKVVSENVKNFAPAKAKIPTNSANLPSTTKYKNDLEAIQGAAIATIPTRFGQQQLQNQLSKTRNDGDRINLIASIVLKQAPAETKRDFANQAVGLSEIDKAIALLDSGVKTGVVKNAAQYTYNIFGKDFDPKIAAINAHLVAAIQPYRNSVTGAAWGKQEDAEYNQLFGSTKYSPVELKQRLEQVKEVLKSKSANGLNVYINPLNTYSNPFQSGGLAPNKEVITGPDKQQYVFTD